MKGHKNLEKTIEADPNDSESGTKEFAMPFVSTRRLNSP